MKEIDNNQVSAELLKRNIEWKFNPPHAFNQGGIWEREIRTFRKIFTSLLKNYTLTDESLTTLFCEVENVMNSRPLTIVSSDKKDLNPISPNQLLKPKSDCADFINFF